VGSEFAVILMITSPQPAMDVDDNSKGLQNDFVVNNESASVPKCISLCLICAATPLKQKQLELVTSQPNNFDF